MTIGSIGMTSSYTWSTQLMLGFFVVVENTIRGHFFFGNDNFYLNNH